MSGVSLDHVSVTTADLARSIAFYRDVIGLSLTGRGESAEPALSRLTGLKEVRVRWAELDLGEGQLLELLEYVTPAGEPLEQGSYRPGSGHIGFAVTELDAPVARLRAAGALVSDRPVVLAEAGAWNGVRCVLARDPDGVTIELVERAAGVVRVPDLEAEQA